MFRKLTTTGVAAGQLAGGFKPQTPLLLFSHFLFSDFSTSSISPPLTTTFIFFVPVLLWHLAQLSCLISIRPPPTIKRARTSLNANENNGESRHGVDACAHVLLPYLPSCELHAHADTLLSPLFLIAGLMMKKDGKKNS